jgi:hypothetical protein
MQVNENVVAVGNKVPTYNQLLRDADATGEVQTVTLIPADGDIYIRLTVKMTGDGYDRIAKWSLGGKRIQPFLAKLLLSGYAVGWRK